jgi:hypothetical protein
MRRSRGVENPDSGNGEADRSRGRRTRSSSPLLKGRGAGGQDWTRHHAGELDVNGMYRMSGAARAGCRGGTHTSIRPRCTTPGSRTASKSARGGRARRARGARGSIAWEANSVEQSVAQRSRGADYMHFRCPPPSRVGCGVLAASRIRIRGTERRRSSALHPRRRLHPLDAGRRPFRPPGSSRRRFLSPAGSGRLERRMQTICTFAALLRVV